MIYLDNAATTAPNKEALRIATQKYEELFYNPSASYKQGAEVHALIEDCKRTILETLVNEEDIADYDIIFTGSGTEADNLAVRWTYYTNNPVLISNKEHSGIYETAKKSFRVYPTMDGDDYFLRENFSIYPCPNGILASNELLKFEDDDKDRSPLVSYVHVSNETSEITDIVSLAKKVKERYPEALFHSDGVQAYGKIPYTLDSRIDMYSISAHKIGGIKGVGALVVRKDVIPRLHPVIYGGGQGNGLRSGTENVLGIIDFAEAVKRWGNPRDTVDEEFSFDTRVIINSAIVRRLRDTLWEFLDKEKFVRISPEDGSPYILTVSAKGKNNEVIQKILEEKYGILVGIGSACSSNHAENKGRVLRALGYGDNIINGALRFSFSPQTTVEEIRTAAKAVNEVVGELA